MADIFFSYSSRDRDRVQPVHDRLAAHGFHVFWDQGIPAGSNWDIWIRNGLGRAKCALVFWSAQSVLSDNVVHEATVAKQQGKLLPVLLDPLAAEQFPMGLYTVQAANLATWNGDVNDVGFKRLLGELEKRLTPLWMRHTIDRLEAELVAERARREATERRDRTLQDQISKEAQAQIDILRDRDRALAANEALQAELASTCAALIAAQTEVGVLATQLKATTEKMDAPGSQASAIGRPATAASSLDQIIGDIFPLLELPEPAGPHLVDGARRAEDELWVLASRPDGDYGSELWAKKQNLEKFLTHYPRGAHAEEARKEIRRIDVAEAWRWAAQSGRKADIQAFLDRYPSSPFANAARELLRKKWF